MSSSTHRVRRADHFDDLQWETGYRPFAAYGRSKLANLLFTYELRRRLVGTSAMAVAAQPGGSATELMRNAPRLVQTLSTIVMQSPAMGALPTLRAATDPSVLGGQFYGPAGLGQVRGYPEIVTSSDRSYEMEIQERIWAVSEKLTGVTYRIAKSVLHNESENSDRSSPNAGRRGDASSPSWTVAAAGHAANPRTRRARQARPEIATSRVRSYDWDLSSWTSWNCWSVTGSSHVVPSPPSVPWSRTMWLMQVVFVPPCQCSSPGGVQTVSPARIRMT